MKNYSPIANRSLTLAHYILENKTTIRATAKYFNLSKSTVHLDLSKRLKYLNKKLYSSVQKLLKSNFAVKHIRGGESTKLRYNQLKQESKLSLYSKYDNI